MAAGTRDPACASHLIDHLPIVGEFAAAAGGLLGERLVARHHEALGRERIEDIIGARRFSAVFQPIVDLASGEPVGHEALTRFDDGTPPERMFAAAALAGLAPVLARSTRAVVLEITEHVEIDDYVAIRNALLRLGPSIRLSVDDAGAGFASLRHVVELGPAYIKLDHWLVHEVDRDPVRQAMVAGLAQFVRRVGSELIAEGIEQPGELGMVRELGVRLGQGYLLGRPAPVRAPAGTGDRHGRPRARVHRTAQAVSAAASARRGVR